MICSIFMEVGQVKKSLVSTHICHSFVSNADFTILLNSVIHFSVTHTLSLPLSPVLEVVYAFAIHPTLSLLLHLTYIHTYF